MTIFDRLLGFCEIDYSPPRLFPIAEANLLYDETLDAIKNHSEGEDEDYLIGTVFTLLKKMQSQGYEVQSLKTRAVEIITKACSPDPDLRSFLINQVND